MIVVAKNLSVLQLFISRMPKMCAILQLVSAPLNPIYNVYFFHECKFSPPYYLRSARTLVGKLAVI